MLSDPAAYFLYNRLQFLKIDRLKQILCDSDPKRLLCKLKIIISGQKELTKNKSGMVIHNNIMTSENHQQKDAGQVYRKCCQGRKHICQTRTGHENRKEEGNNAKSMGDADSKISLSEN